MLVHNKEARVHAIGPHCTLKPGVNDVPDEDWAAAKKIELVQHYLEIGNLVEIQTRSGSSNISALPTAQQRDVVRNINDLDLLEKVGKGAKGVVAKAVEEKKAELKKRPGPGNDSDTDDAS